MSVSDRENAPAHLPSDQSASKNLRPVMVLRPFGDFAVPSHWNREVEGRSPTWGFRPKVIGTSSHALDAFLASRGYSLEQVSAPRFSLGEGVSDFVFPRNLEWKILPVAGNAVREHVIRQIGPVHASGFVDLERDYGDGRDVTPPDLLAGVELLIIDCAILPDEALWAAIAPYYAEILMRRIEIVWFDGTVFEPLSRDRIDAAADRSKVADRLDWSHSINFAIFMSKAIHAIAREENWTARELRRRMPRLDDYFKEAFTPLALQLLYALDRHFPVVRHRDLGLPNDIFERMNRLIEACPFVSSDPETDGFIFTWLGSGKFPPIITKVERQGSFRQHTIYDVTGHWLPFLLSNLHRNRLISIGNDGRMGITPFGHRLLELMGRSAEDSDVLLRWRGAGSDAIPSVDRWLNKAFRAMKRRVSPLPSHTLAERNDGTIPSENCYMVYGGYVAFDEGMLSDPAVLAEIERIAHENKGKPFEEQTYGLVTPPERLVRNEPPYGAWYGVPLSICEDWRAQDFYGWYTDYSGLESAVSAIEASLPEILRSRTTLGRQPFSVGETLERVKSFKDVRPCVSECDRLFADKILIGWCLRIPSGSYRDPEIIRSLKGLSLAEPFGNGMHCQGNRSMGDGTTVVWSTVEVGVLNADGQEIVCCDDHDRMGRIVSRALRSGVDSLNNLGKLVAIEGTLGLYLKRHDGVPEPTTVRSDAVRKGYEAARAALAPTT